jgi:capsular exopolysaccharide synthesis family protein
MKGARSKETFLLTRQEPHSLVAEAYRSIRTSLRFAAIAQNRKVIMFTSPLSGEGKTTSVSNLGILTAQDGKKTLLIDGDLRRPNLHHIFRIPNRTGLSSYLSGYSSVQDMIAATEISNLSVLPAGPIQPSPSELLGTHRLHDLLQYCKEEFDVIFIDVPPLLAVSDPAIVARAVDGIVVLIRALLSRREHIQKAQRILEPFHDKVIGFVMNDKLEGP